METHVPLERRVWVAFAAGEFHRTVKGRIQKLARFTPVIPRWVACFRFPRLMASAVTMVSCAPLWMDVRGELASVYKI